MRKERMKVLHELEGGESFSTLRVVCNNTKTLKETSAFYRHEDSMHEYSDQAPIRRPVNRCSIIVFAGLLAGCARFESEPISPANNAAQLDARRLDDVGLKKFLERNLAHDLETWPPKAWDFNTLTFAAYYFNPSLDVARAQWNAAQAGVRTAGGRPNPTLNLIPGYNFSASSGVSPWIPFLSVDVPVETAGKRGHRIAKAQHLSESWRLNIATVAWQVRRNVRGSLLDVTVAEGRAALLERQLRVQETIVNLLEQRLAAGAISQPDLTAARIGLNKTRLGLGDAHSKRAEARARLAEALGVGASALDGAELSADFADRSADQLTSADARRVALQRRSDILSALGDYAAAEADLRLQIAKQYPDVHFSPGYQYDQGDNKWTLGIALELPALNQNQGPIAEARAHRDEAAARFTEVQAKVIGELDRAGAAYRAAREQLTATDALLSAAQQQQQSAEAQLKAGAADPLDRLTAEFELSVAALAQLDGQAALQQSIGALEDALQQPIDAAGPMNSGGVLVNAAQNPRGRPTQ
jgi:outer membrane protein TolC